MATAKIDTAPNPFAIKTKQGWQDKDTGEIYVSAYGYFTDATKEDVPRTKALGFKGRTIPKPTKPGGGSEGGGGDGKKPGQGGSPGPGG